MYDFKIGIVSGCLDKDDLKAIEIAAAMGADGIQLDAGKGRYNLPDMTQEKFEEIEAAVKKYNLKIPAICGDIGKILTNKEDACEVVPRLKKTLDMAKKLGVNIVFAHIGMVPEDTKCEKYKVVLEALTDIAKYAESIGSCFAIETGPERSMTLKKLLDTIPYKGIGINLDPGNLMMIQKENAVEAVHNLKEYIVHTHAKDGKQFRAIPPEKIYENHNNEPIDWTDPPHLEFSLGNGDVNYPEYLKALDEIGYSGFLTIEREFGPDPIGDIKLSVEFLKKLINRNN